MVPQLPLTSTWPSFRVPECHAIRRRHSPEAAPHADCPLTLTMMFMCKCLWDHVFLDDRHTFQHKIRWPPSAFLRQILTGLGDSIEQYVEGDLEKGAREPCGQCASFHHSQIVGIEMNACRIRTHREAYPTCCCPAPYLLIAAKLVCACSSTPPAVSWYLLPGNTPPHACKANPSTPEHET